MSGLSFQMPPQMSLSKTTQTKLCKMLSCTHLFGLVDDLNLPRCEVFFDNRNLTLQKETDSFAPLRDNVSPLPLLLKKKKVSSSSPGSSLSSLYGHKRKERVSSGVKDVTTSTNSLVLVITASLALVAPMIF